jgi:hypothetical protein
MCRDFVCPHKQNTTFLLQSWKKILATPVPFSQGSAMLTTSNAILVSIFSVICGNIPFPPPPPSFNVGETWEADVTWFGSTLYKGRWGN